MPDMTDGRRSPSCEGPGPTSPGAGGAPVAGSPERDRSNVAGRVARELWVRGVVQGVGFRPFIYGLAGAHRLDGWVRNTSAGVQIVVEGPPAAVEAFCAALPEEAPPRSFIASLEVEDVEPSGASGFTIVESAAEPGAYQLVSPDIALCPDCRRELLDPDDRRHGYPFTNCTNCGPRFTIIEELPYDRERTTMRAFPLCPDCRAEYEDPADRRFHAEPNACPVCGPRTVLLASAERAAAMGVESAGSATAADIAERGRPERAGHCGAAGDVDGELVVLSRSGKDAPAAAVERAAELLRDGRIVALKGLGGFHLACDATDGAVVRELKDRKGRPHKPLAVMFSGLEQLRAHCRVSEDEAELLESPEHPIVLLEWREVGPSAEMGPELGDGSAEDEISGDVAVRQRYLGAMLPYTPLHLLLMQAVGRPLVMTSGNRAEEPIVKGYAEAGRLGHIPDAYLLHDRRIHARYDDSVALVRRGRPRMLRRSRGYAPFPVSLPRDLPQILACGAELKNTFCLTRDRNAFLSQHIGDLENLETLEHFETSIALYEELFHVEPEVVAFDLHPEYLATKWALEHLAGRRPVAVQHHHAHVVKCMVDAGRVEADGGRQGADAGRAGSGAGLRKVVGVSLDGLGFGADGRLWGGELMICDALSFTRVAHLEYLPLPGGELAIRRPARTAAGWLAALSGPEAVDRARAAGLELDDAEAAVVLEQVRTGLNAPLTSSCGRLFDCVAALAGLRGVVTYEGQAAIELEMVSRAGGKPYPLEVSGDLGAALSQRALRPAAAPGALRESSTAPLAVGLGPLLDAVLADVESGATPGDVGSRLHATVTALVVDLCGRVRAETGLDEVALTGGVFQNRLLTSLCEDALEDRGFTVLTPALLPANDGGLSVGQAVVAGYTVEDDRGALGPAVD